MRRDWDSGFSVLDGSTLEHEGVDNWIFTWTDNFIEIDPDLTTSRIRNILFYT